MNLGLNSKKAIARILVVEDDEILREMIEKMLDHCGFASVCIDTPQAALDTLAQEPESFDLLMSDVSMPEMNGPELLRKARQLRPGLPALLVSGHTPERLQREAVLPDVSFLPKPFNYASLLTYIQQAIAPIAVA